MEKLDREFREFRVLLRNVPGTALTFFVVSVILMNLLANKELDLGVSWLALDCGFSVSWMGFLAQDMITKRFGAKASIEISIFALAINLFISGVLFFALSNLLIMAQSDRVHFSTENIPECHAALVLGMKPSEEHGMWY